MPMSQRAGRIVAGTLLLSVATQLIYMAWLGGPSASDPAVGTTHADRALYFDTRWPAIASVWTTELAIFLLMAVAALVALVRARGLWAMWAALAVAGLFNALQVGIGLATFRPAVTAGDALEPLFTAVLGAAFLFYFIAKALIGLAGVGAGLVLLRQASGLAKTLGVAAGLAGLAAAGANIAAIAVGRSLTFPAGATGTAAALTLGIALWWVVSKVNAEALDRSPAPV